MAERREDRRKSSLAFPYELDSERGRFTRFMDESGVIKVFIEVFHALYNEPIKPKNSIEWIRQYLWSRAGQAPGDMRAEIERLRDEVVQVATEYEELKNRMQGQRQSTVGKAIEIPTSPILEETPARAHCGDSSTNPVPSHSSKTAPVHTLQNKDKPPPPLNTATNEVEDKQAENEVVVTPTMTAWEGVQVEHEHRLKFSPEGELLIDHSTETSPQPSSYQLGGMDNEKDEQQEEADEEETGHLHRSEPAVKDEDGPIATKMRSPRSPSKSKFKSKSKSSKSKSIKSKMPRAETLSGRESKKKHSHGGHKGKSVLKKSQLHVSGDREEEEDEESHESHVQISISRILAMRGLGYNPCGQFSDNCIGPEFWTRHLSPGPLEPDQPDTGATYEEQDQDSLFYENIIVAVKSQVEKPQALLKTPLPGTYKSNSEPVEEFSWLPSILDAGAHSPSNWSVEE